MPSTTSYKQGDIVLVNFPFTDLSSTKKRPALVISPDTFNALNQDLILVAITSQLGDNPHAIPLSRDDFEEGQPPKKSMVKPTKLFTIHSALVVKRICSLRKQKLDEILEAVRQFYS